MKKVLLIGPYNPNGRVGQYIAPPLGVYRMASYLKNKGIAEVDVVDPSLDYREVFRKLSTKKYDIIGHSILHPTIEHDLRLIVDVHKAQPEALQIAGGQGAVFNHSEILEKSPIQIVIRGFGEKIIEKIIIEEDLENIPSIYLKKIYLTKDMDKKDMQSQDMEKHREIEDRKISVLSTPCLNGMTSDIFKEISEHIDFNDIPYEKYWTSIEMNHDINHFRIMKNEGMLRTVRLVTSNYCPMGCTFCTSTNFLNEGHDKKQNILILEPEDIMMLMNSAAKAHPGLESFYFNDDNFIIDKNRVERLCDLLRKSHNDYNLMCMGRVDSVDIDLLKNMKDAGFKIIFYGVETFSDDMAISLRKTQKPGYGNLARCAIENTMKAGLTPQISLMLFLPKSSERDLVITIENSLDMMDEGARVTVFPYVEAYSGADIINHHELTYDEFIVDGEIFRMPGIVLPDDLCIRKIAEESLKLKSEINMSMEKDFNGHIPQPVDTLNLFSAIYQKLGRNTDRIERIKQELIMGAGGIKYLYKNKISMKSICENKKPDIKNRFMQNIIS